VILSNSTAYPTSSLRSWRGEAANQR
jgi:hypothetical protein